MKLNITKLSKQSKVFQKKYKEEIKDIILFGSSLRGKSEPEDIDILIIFNKKINKEIEYEFKKQVSKIIEDVSLISKTEDTLYDHSFAARQSILFDGYSLVKKQFIVCRSGCDYLGICIYYT